MTVLVVQDDVFIYVQGEYFGGVLDVGVFFLCLWLLLQFWFRFVLLYLGVERTWGRQVLTVGFLHMVSMRGVVSITP
jgi:hypothetical protein